MQRSRAPWECSLGARYARLQLFPSLSYQHCNSPGEQVVSSSSPGIFPFSEGLRVKTHRRPYEPLKSDIWPWTAVRFFLKLMMTSC